MCAMISGLFIGSNDGRPPQAYKENFVSLKVKLACHPARCVLSVGIIEKYGLASGGPATVELLSYLLPY